MLIEKAKKWELIGLALISLSMLAVCAHFNIDFENRQGLSINVNYYGSVPPLFILSGIAGTTMIVVVSQILSRYKLDTILTISNGTIIILGCHWALFKCFKGVIVEHSVIAAIAYSFINIYICYVLIRLTDRYAPWLLGNRKIR